MKKLLYFHFLLLLIHSVSNVAYCLELHGFNFDDNAFADNVVYISGKLEFGGFTPTGNDDIDLDTALTGANISTYLTSEYIPDLNIRTGYTVEIEFIDNYLFNGIGTDLIGWEYGTPEPFMISIFDPSSDAWTSYMNFSITDIGPMNIAEIDLDHWGLATDLQIKKIRISSEHWANSWIDADIAAFGGLNSAPAIVPEPTTMILIGCGILILTGFRKFFYRSNIDRNK